MQGHNGLVALQTASTMSLFNLLVSRHVLLCQWSRRARGCVALGIACLGRKTIDGVCGILEASMLTG